MYETPELDKLNGDTASPTSIAVYEYTFAAVDTVVLGVVVGVVFLALVQFDTTFPLSIPNEPE